jgi:hypothetical protein
MPSVKAQKKFKNKTIKSTDLKSNINLRIKITLIQIQPIEKFAMNFCIGRPDNKMKQKFCIQYSKKIPKIGKK